VHGVHDRARGCPNFRESALDDVVFGALCQRVDKVDATLLAGPTSGHSTSPTRDSLGCRDKTKAMKLRRVGAVLGLLLCTCFAGFAACSSKSKSSEPTLCELAPGPKDDDGGATCTELTDCDTTLTGACGTLNSVLSTSILDAARGCLESGVCGLSVCLRSAGKGGVASSAHQALADAFCASCDAEANREKCISVFLTPGRASVGGVTLAYNDAVVNEIRAQCTGKDGCKDAFNECASETAANTVGKRIDAKAAECVKEALSREQSAGAAGPTGSPVLQTCDKCKAKGGCCNSLNECVKGDSNDACGANGDACQQCVGDLQCINAACTRKCDDSWSGCCQGDIRASGTSTTACGKNGEACKVCDERQSCVDRQCL